MTESHGHANYAGHSHFHHHITEAVFPHPAGLLKWTAAFDTAIDLCATHSAPSKRTIVCLLLGYQPAPTWLLCGLEDGHAFQREPLKASPFNMVIFGVSASPVQVSLY